MSKPKYKLLHASDGWLVFRDVNSTGISIASYAILRRHFWGTAR
jgi:hypothetical protein